MHSEDLTPEERKLLLDYQGSELMRVIKKAILHYRGFVESKVLAADIQHLPVCQGELRGVTGVINVLSVKATQAKEEETRRAKMGVAQMGKPGSPRPLPGISSGEIPGA